MKIAKERPRSFKIVLVRRKYKPFTIKLLLFGFKDYQFGFLTLSEIWFALDQA